jgi:multimeric flavodoxin WrbA
VKAYILSDGEFAGDRLQKLDSAVRRCLQQKGFEITERRLEPEELKYCAGCFGCWVKTPGRCVLKDSMDEINRTAMNSDVVVYLVPLVFGQFSANMKSALDRWIPNILPFFIVRKDGSTMHPARYAKNPRIVMIAYGDGLTAEDTDLFRDITAKNRRNGAVLVYGDDDETLARELLAIDLMKAGDQL